MLRKRICRTAKAEQILSLAKDHEVPTSDKSHRMMNPNRKKKKNRIKVPICQKKKLVRNIVMQISVNPVVFRMIVTRPKY